METDKIDSDDQEFHNRKRNFDIISKKLNRYYEQKYHLFRGNDLRYNNYIRKLQKLSKKESLDAEGYKDFVTNYKKLINSNSDSLNAIANIYLNELINREELSKETKETLSENEKGNDNYVNLKSLHMDFKSIMEHIEKSSENAIKKVFLIKDLDTEKVNNTEIEDLKNLRIAKYITKLRQFIINKQLEEANDKGTNSEFQTVK
jgi:hypothetical protein